MADLRVVSIYDGSGPISTATQGLAGAGWKAWVNFNGTSTVQIRASFGVAGITDHGTGDYSVNFSPSLSTETYGFFVTTGGTSSAYNHRTIEDGGVAQLRTPTAIRFYTITAAGVLVDPAFVSCAAVNSTF